jgi:hypothetical protein
MIIYADYEMAQDKNRESKNKKLGIRITSNRSLINPTPLNSAKSYVFLLLFSLPFLLVGLGLLGQYYGYFSTDNIHNVTEKKIILIAGLVFFLSGLSVFLKAVIQLIKILLKRNARIRYPKQAWRWDYSWDKRGYHHSFLKRLLYNLFGLGLILGIFIPGLILAFNKKEMPLFFLGMIVFFAVIFFAIGIYEIIKTLKFRSVSCLYSQFPYEIGKNFQVSIKGLPSARKIESLQCQIKCYEFRMIETQRGNKKSYERVSVELFKEDIDVNVKHIKNGRLGISGRFPSSEKLGTDFTKDNFVCWELSIVAEIPGVDFKYGFLLPVYNIAN